MALLEPLLHVFRRLRERADLRSAAIVVAKGYATATTLKSLLHAEAADRCKILTKSFLIPLIGAIESFRRRPLATMSALK